MKLVLVLFNILFFIQFSLTQNYQGTTSSSENNNTLIELQKIIDKTSILQLPFSFNSDSLDNIKSTYLNHEQTTSVFREYDSHIISIIGRLENTDNYYGFFCFIHADELIPTLITINKRGEIIAFDHLASSCWKGCESDCRFNVSIDEKLRIETRQEEFIYEFEMMDDEIIDCGNFPIEANGTNVKSFIDLFGNRIIESSTNIPFEELMKNPIIH